jgi:hypothetical protein
VFLLRRVPQLETLRADPAKSQLMLAAAMRRNRFFFVTESSRNDPETVSALPHRVLLSPQLKLH